MKPHNWQEQAARDYGRLGGVFVGLDPGVGKTFSAALIARDCLAAGRQPLVVAPAGAITQTRTAFEGHGVRTAMAAERLRGVVAFASYTWLQRKEQAEFFTEFRPDDILCDEFHEFRRILTNSAAKRVDRYVSGPGGKHVRVGVFTGSPSSGLLSDFAHGLHWALPAHTRWMPPSRWGVAQLEEQMAASAEAREKFYAKLRCTPGVYLDVDVGRYEGKVTIRTRLVEAWGALPPTWELPDGYALTGPAEAASVQSRLAWGYWPRVTPRPSPAYLEARRAWSGLVRRYTTTGRADTEGQVKVACPEEAAAWARVEEAEPPRTVENVWMAEAFDRLSPLVLSMTRPGVPTIVWAYHVELQRRMAQVLGCPLHGALGRDESGTTLDQTRAHIVVASIESCHQAFNAQHFAHNIVLEPPADPEVLKQLIGRTARQGQRRDEVTVMLVYCGSTKNLTTALERARMIRDMTGKNNPLLLGIGKGEHDGLGISESSSVEVRD